MRQALAQAARGRYSAAPNPAVGCVLVRDGRAVGRGFHRRAGEAHAEVAALAAAGDAAAGATAYVTLEPCNHHGRTGPCSEALIAAGVKRVVYAAEDPNPGVTGGGAARLRAAGIEVTGGVCAEAAGAEMAAFLHRARHGRPRVRVKLAMSLDGGAALASGESQWITGPAARDDVQRLRAEACAVVTGIGTVLADDPSLNVRDARFDTGGRQPRRIVLDSQLRMPSGARMLALDGETRLFVATPGGERRAALEAAGAVVESLAAGPRGLDLGALIERLAALECNDVLVEAGPTLAGRFLAEGRFDQLLVYLAPKLLGRDARRALDLPSPQRLADARDLVLVEQAPVGEDLRLVFQPRR